jgi:protein disulfide-isomerase-like protein
MFRSLVLLSIVMVSSMTTTTTVFAFTPQIKAVINNNDEVEIPGASEYVTRLTTADFEYSLKQESSAFVEFYAPWCGHCKKLEPEFVSAAKYFQNVREMIGFFKVDATIEKKLAKKYGVDGFPTILYVENITASKYSIYEGARTAKGIKEFLKQRNSNLALANLKELKTAEAFSKFLSFKDAVFVGAFESKESEQFKAFIKAASYEEVPYAYTLNADVAKAASIDTVPGMNIMVNTGEIFKFTGSMTNEHAIDAFAIHRQFGSTIYYSARVHKKIFDSQFDSQLILFVKDKGVENKEEFEKSMKLNGKLQDMFVAESKKYVKEHGHGTTLPRWVLVRVNKFLLPEDFPYVYKLGHACNIRKEVDFPQLCYFHKKLEGEGASAKNTLQKYSREAATITSPTAFIQFIEDIKDGKVEEIKQSELKPDTTTESSQLIKTLVGENFEEKIFNEWKDQNVLVMIYANWCKASISVMPEYEALAEKLFPNTRNIILAKFDAAANEARHKAAKSDKYPRFRLFKASRKDNEEYVEFKGEKGVKPTKQILTKFVKEHIFLMDDSGLGQKVDL